MNYRGFLLRLLSLVIVFQTIVLKASELDNISVQRLAGQMILIGFKGTSKSDYLVKKLGQEASLGRLSGVVFNANNLQNLEQSKELIARFANIAVTNPLILALNTQGLEGEFEHLNNPDFASSTQPLSTLRLEYLKNALEIYNLGINTVIGPNLNAWVKGSNLDKLSLYAQQYSDALNQAGLLKAALKFPGVPAYMQDQHPIAHYYLDWLKPFYDAVATNNVDFMVITNKIIKPLDPLRPAAQSPKIIRLLRQDLDYKGLIVAADILGGDLDSQDFKDRIIKSINAGCNLLYFSTSVIKYGDTASTVVDIISKAVANKQISRLLLEQNYLKIKELKQKLRKNSAFNKGV